MPAINIVDRYIVREILFTWMAVAVVLFIVVSSVEVVQFLKWFLRGDLTTDTILPLYINSQLKFLVQLLPISMFLGVLLAFSRLYMHSEMTAMMASGIGLRHLSRVIFIVLIPVFLLELWMMLYMRPMVELERADIRAQIRDASVISTLLPGRFNTLQEGKAVIFMESISDDGKQMKNIFQRFDRDGVTHVDLASSGRNVTLDTKLDYMLFENGRHYIGSPGEANYQIIDYAEYGVLIPEREDVFYPLRVRAHSTRELWQSDKPEYKAELDWRISIPVAMVILVMMALPLSQTTPRGGRYAKLALAILLYLIYSNLLGVSKTWIAKGMVPYWIGSIWVHLLALIVLYLLFKRSGMLAGRPAKTIPAIRQGAAE